MNRRCPSCHERLTDSDLACSQNASQKDPVLCPVCGAKPRPWLFGNPFFRFFSGFVGYVAGYVLGIVLLVMLAGWIWWKSLIRAASLGAGNLGAGGLLG